MSLLSCVELGAQRVPQTSISVALESAAMSMQHKNPSSRQELPSGRTCFAAAGFQSLLFAPTRLCSIGMVQMRREVNK